MNLHGIAGPVIAAVNPMVSVTVRISNGYATNSDGSRTPSYQTPVTVQAQIQAMTYRDLQQVDGLNLNGTRRAIYLYGAMNGVVRVSQQGGDLITTADGNVWLTALVLEQWPDWVKVAVTLQNGS